MLAVLFRLFLRQRLLDDARVQADRGIAGLIEGHAGMDMTVHGDGTMWQRLRSPQGFTSVSHVFVMERAPEIRDIVGGLLIAGAVAAWAGVVLVAFLLTDHPVWPKIWGRSAVPAGVDHQLRLLDRHRRARGRVPSRERHRPGTIGHLEQHHDPGSALPDPLSPPPPATRC